MNDVIQPPTLRQQIEAEKFGTSRSRLTILRRRDVEARTGLSRSTIYDWINPKCKRYKPDFPKPVNLGGGASVGWVESEIEGWLIAQIEASRAAAA